MTYRPSALVLIIANMIPLIGVAFFEWRVIDILLLYWTESVIIGVINVLRMSRCQTNNLLGGLLPAIAGKEIPAELKANLPKISLPGIKFFIIPFFILHYGGFCFGHLMAVIGLFGETGLRNGLGASLQYFWQPEYWLAVAAIAASHMYSYFSNYIGRNEFQHTSLFLLMQRPYGRIVAMHIAIVFGAGLVMWLGSALPMLVVLILAKTAMDLRLHEGERAKFAMQA
ncbi:MAG: hypothetical protein ACI88G_000164 [Woeseiaceae bacterium]|jgi:hypothetical protein